MFYINLVFRNIRKQSYKSLLTALICALMVLFMFIYIGNISIIKKQLDRLPAALPVSAQVSDHCGTQAVGLLIDGSLIEQLRVSESIKDLLYTTRLVAMIASAIPDEEGDDEMIVIAGANDLAAFPFLSGDDITLTSGSVQDFMSERQAGVIVEETFLHNNNLNPGDYMTLPLYYIDFGEIEVLLQYNKISDIDVLIAGSFTPSEATGSIVIPAMICSAGWIEELLRANDLPFYADSASFFVRDPFQLNEFKAEMNQIGFLSVSPQAPPSMNGIGLSVNDKTFISSAGSMQKNLLIMRAFMPFIFLLIILVGYIASYLMTLSKRTEVAMMRGVGVSQKMCTVVLTVESAILALFGCLIVVIVASLLTDIGLTDGIVISVAYYGGYMIGSAIAVVTLGRFSVMEVLTKAE